MSPSATQPEALAFSVPRTSYGMVRAMGTAREDWPRLASYVVSARLAAGYKDRRSLAAATEVTERTLGKLETGQRVSSDTLAAVEQAVGWRPDSARMILRGEEPVPQDSPDPTLQAIWEDARLTEEERRIAVAFIEAIRKGRARRDAATRPAANDALSR